MINKDVATSDSEIPSYIFDKASSMIRPASTSSRPLQASLTNSEVRAMSKGAIEPS